MKGSMKTIMAGAVCLILCSMAYATLTDYVCTQVPDQGWGPGVAPGRTNSLCLASGVYAPPGCYVQKLRANAVGNVTLPPTTNVYAGGTNSFCEFPLNIGGNGTPPQSGWYTFVGNDDLAWGLSDAGMPGRLTTSLDGAASQFGTLRLFSATTVTGAAYYGDVKPERTLTGGDAFTASPVQTRADQINPAYKMSFVSYPTNLPGALPVVTGSVFASSAGLDNQFPSAMIRVDWRFVGESAWRLGTDSLGPNGQFQFLPGGFTGATSIFVRACVKDAYCQPGRTNLPATTSYLGTSGMDTSDGYGPLPVALFLPPPFVDITIAPQTVIYDVTSTSIGGSNNWSTVALWWSNSLTGATGPQSPGTPWWIINNIGLAVGANTITVFATNALGVQASASVTVTRGDITTGTPFVDVTNAAQAVTYDVATTDVGGSNNPSVVALWWSNSLAAAGGTLAPGSPWWTIGGIGLAVGANTITVYGTNALGVASSSSVMVTRGGPGTGTPFVLVTNTPPHFVSNMVTTVYLTGTNNENVAGAMYWTNLTTGAIGPLARNPSSNTWDTTVVSLAVGANHIHVIGTNVYGIEGFDNVTVVRLDAGTNPPYIDITNGHSLVVIYDVTSATFGGTNYNVVGTMRWSNVTANTGGSFPAASPWTLTVNGLLVGVNQVYIYGTNAYGAIASEFIDIVRGAPGTGMPFVDITNTTFVADITLPCVLAGTNNMNVVGSMWISNTANGSAASFPAAPSWTSAGVNLDLVTNLVMVFGSNTVGSVTNDVVVVVGIPEGVGICLAALGAAMLARKRR